MKKRISEQFNIKHYSVDRKGTLSIFFSIYLLAVIFLILTSGFSIDRSLSDGFGGAMFKTHGGFNKLVRGGATYFDYEPYRQPYILIAASLFVVLESISKKIIQDHKNSGGAKHDCLLFVVEMIISAGVLVDVLKGFYGDYTYHSEFGEGFYIGTMAGKDILLPAYIVTCVVMVLILFSFTGYVHFKLARRDDFVEGNYGKLAIINVVFFLVINFEYINGLKYTFNRKYEVNYKFGDGIGKVNELYPEHYDAYINSGKNGGYPVGHGEFPTANYPSSINAPGYKANPKGTGGDAFPSGHMNCVLFNCLTLFNLFRNPQTKEQKTTSRIMTAVGTLYLLNMGLILEYSGSHGMSDMSFTLVTVPVLYVIGYFIFSGFVILASKIYKDIKLGFRKY